ncbi:MAG: hypothetical protein A2X61_00810 [Ignavibacteria bacterium GWB2_35_12]|nr:MAG: hypothetical protein A2X61_00810 [Ignavibacteria bacterium GWB2_35_12]OGU87542.1 MAG: hypothetical protein A2220_15570 [Ignavibacteria bacterium RIFOXYA2_FULL_35_10]OGV21733.1 MAG: hypothetical protein A2475_04035 [Ignavibacteria bacterium RIFOXYC2_FULL_35_21]
MDKPKLILNQMLDLGGIATKNNFFSPEAKTILGALVHTRKAFNELENQKLIKPINTITKVRNLCQEQFFSISRLGSQFVGRTKEYKWKGATKSPYNIMHESMIRDIALGFLRFYHQFIFEIQYHQSFTNLRPDLFIKMTHKSTMKQYIFLVEVERKKTVDRVINEKLQKYENVLKDFNFKRYNLNAPVKVLVVYANLDFNCFWRPQEYFNQEVRVEIEKLHKQLQYLSSLVRYLPENRYRFLSFYNFYRLHEPIWLTPSGRHVGLLDN